MKKLLACIVAATLLLLPGCGPEVDPEEPEEQEQPDPKPDPKPEPDPEPEPDPGPELTISFTSPWTDLFLAESVQLACSVGGKDYDPQKKYEISYSSSDTHVAGVTANGRVTGVSHGSAIIRATLADTGAYAERTVWVVDLSQVKKAYSKELKFSCGYTMYYKSVTQSWDFFDDCLYACQISGSLHALSYTRKPVHQQDPQQYMHLKYFGHGDNMFVERCHDGDYLWTSNYGTLESGSTNRYLDSQVLSRVRFQDGVTMLPAESDDNYVYPARKRIIAAYDADNGTVGIWCRDNSGKAWFYVYDIETLKAAPAESIKLSYSLSYGSPVVTERPTVNARDISKITPVLSFQMPFNNVPQGFDWHHGKIWLLRGDGAEADEVAAGTNKNWATAYLISSEGKTLVNVAVPWVANLDLLNSEGLTDLGYFEPEGIKVKDGVLYLGFASKDAGSSPPRRLNIFKYPLDE